MPPPSLPPGRANVADFYAARRGIIPPLPWPTFSPAFSHAFPNGFSAAADGGKFPVFPKVIADGLGTASAAQEPESAFSGPIFSGPCDLAISVPSFVSH
jgi:hypothetical protein